MKKFFPIRFLTVSFIIALFSFGSMNCSAHCPIDSQCQNKGSLKQEIPQNQYFSPAQDKLQEDKKAEFEARLNLTKKQREKLEKIKAEEQKELAPLKTEIQKTHAKLHELMNKEQLIRQNSIKKFESMLNKKQKAELEKIKSEIEQELKPIPEDIK